MKKAYYILQNPETIKEKLTFDYVKILKFIHGEEKKHKKIKYEMTNWKNCS